MVSMLGNFFEAGNPKFPHGFLAGFPIGIANADDGGISMRSVCGGGQYSLASLPCMSSDASASLRSYGSIPALTKQSKANRRTPSPHSPRLAGDLRGQDGKTQWWGGGSRAWNGSRMPMGRRTVDAVPQGWSTDSAMACRRGGENGRNRQNHCSLDSTRAWLWRRMKED